MRRYTALVFACSSFFAFCLLQQPAPAWMFCFSLAGLWVAEILDWHEAKVIKPTKSVMEMQAQLDLLAAEHADIKNKISALSIGQATKNPFARR